MISLFGRCIIVHIRNALCSGQMVLGTLVIRKNSFLIIIENDGIRFGGNSLFPQLVWLLSLRNLNSFWSCDILTREYSLMRIYFSVVAIVWRLLLLIISLLSLCGALLLSVPRFLAGLGSLTNFLACFVICLFEVSRLSMTVEHVWRTIQSRLSWRLEAHVCYICLLFHQSSWHTHLILERLNIGVFQILEEFRLLSSVELLVRDPVYI